MAKLFLLKNTRKDLEGKCGCCNYEASIVYVLARSKTEAKKLYKDGAAGICGICMSDFITEEGFEIDVPLNKIK